MRPINNEKGKGVEKLQEISLAPHFFKPKKKQTIH